MIICYPEYMLQSLPPPPPKASAVQMKGKRDSEVTNSVLDMHAVSPDLQESPPVVSSVSKITKITYPPSEIDEPVVIEATSSSAISSTQFYKTSTGRPLLCASPLEVTGFIRDHSALFKQAKATDTDAAEATQMAPNT